MCIQVQSTRCPPLWINSEKRTERGLLRLPRGLPPLCYHLGRVWKPVFIAATSIFHTISISPAVPIRPAVCFAADAGRVNSLMKFEGEGGAGPRSPRSPRALPGQFPWHVSLLYRNTTLYSCSGSLLSSEWVLTAANCVHGCVLRVVAQPLHGQAVLLLCAGGPITALSLLCFSFDYMMVRLGSYRPRAEQERFREVLNSTHFVVHPGYRRGTPRYDIAVVKLFLR